MPQQVQCTNCGARMEPQIDGRFYVCSYCRAQLQVAVGADQIAAGMRIDLANGEAFLGHLARALSTAIAEHTKIEHHQGSVMAVEVHLEPDVFVARRELTGGSVVAQHKRVVRGIALKTNTHPLDRWYEMLTQALARHANTSARAAEALAMLTGGRR